jgi:hypothetical protein
MNDALSQKVSARHLQRLAYLYVRQSTLRQALENTESTAGSTRCASARWPWAGRASA